MLRVSIVAKRAVLARTARPLHNPIYAMQGIFGKAPAAVLLSHTMPASLTVSHQMLVAVFDLEK